MRWRNLKIDLSHKARKLWSIWGFHIHVCIIFFCKHKYTPERIVRMPMEVLVLCCTIFVRANIYLCETLALSLILTLYWLWISLPSVISLSRDLILNKTVTLNLSRLILYLRHYVTEWFCNLLSIDWLSGQTLTNSVLSQMICQEMYKISPFFTSAKSNHPTNITSG